MAATATIPATMLAAVLRSPGPASALELATIPVPTPSASQVLIRIRAFGLNRSELFTRQGHSPGVVLPRVLGIECVGTVASCPSGAFQPGTVVTTAMGGLGRAFDGAYAEYTAAPVEQTVALPAGCEERLGWETLGALPEMLQTAYGALVKGLRMKGGETLLVRGGTTSVGLAAAAIAKGMGSRVLGTTRSHGREELMKASGDDEVVIDGGEVAEKVRELVPGGVERVLELIGTTTLLDSLQCVKEGGLCCMVGMVGNKWSFDNFSPMDSIPTAVGLTTYAGGNEDVIATPYADLLAKVERGELKVTVGKVFKLAQIVEAHECMEGNRAGGKIVCLT